MADHRHKRDTPARRIPKAHLVAGPLALLATASAVGLGVVATSPDTRDRVLASSAAEIGPPPQGRPDVISRSASRTSSRTDDARKAEDAEADRAATQRAIRNADTRLWTTVELNLWTSADPDAEQVGLLDDGERVLVTGRRTAERVEIVWKDEARWVTAGYLAEDEPVAEPSLEAACTNGTSVPSGVSPNVVAVHEAVCANFPEITTYGTFRSDGEHSQGLAVDIMVSGARGWEIAEFLRASYADLGISYLIYSQKIWSVERGGEGWRYMPDRGSTTANHYDHVHVTTY